MGDHEQYEDGESQASRLLTAAHGAGEATRAGFQSWAAIPFLQQGRPVGALSVSFDQQRTFHAEERALIVTMAGLAAQAIERTRLFDAEVLARKEVEQANRAKDEFLA